jgi:hypothetical protein
MPASARRTLAANPASPPPTTITRWLLIVRNPKKVLHREGSPGQFRIRHAERSSLFNRTSFDASAAWRFNDPCPWPALCLSALRAFAGSNPGIKQRPRHEHQTGPPTPRTRDAPTLLGPLRDRQAPGDRAGPQTVGKVEHQEAHAQEVKERNSDAHERDSRLTAAEARREGACGELLGPLGAAGHQERPPPPECGDVVEDEQDADVPADALEGVPHVAAVPVLRRVVRPRHRVEEPEDRVERDGGPQHDLGQEKVRHLCVDPGDFLPEVRHATLTDGEFRVLAPQPPLPPEDA